MSVTEAQRHELFEAAKAVFGEANAETFMNLQPSVDYTQLVTKTDLADIKSEFAGMRREMADLKGDLLKKAQLDEMKKTVDTAGEMWPGVEYGLGIASAPLSCGGRSWGHGGDIHGYETRGGVTDTGRAFSVAVTALPGTFQDTPEEGAKAHDAVLATVDAALCGAK